MAIHYKILAVLVYWLILYLCGMGTETFKSIFKRGLRTETFKSIFKRRLGT